MTGDPGTPVASPLHAAVARQRRPLLCGHRGTAATHPENTLESVEAALAAGCDAVEVDVHLTADGALAVIHDATVDRTSDGSGDVEAMTRERLRALDAGAWFAPRFAGARVPLLAEVLDVCRGRALVLVELKADADRHPGAAAAVTAAVERDGAAGSALLLAFDHRHLLRAATASPGVARVALCRTVPDHPAALLARLGAAALAPPARLVDARLCATVHAAGALVVAWTVDEPSEAARLAAGGADVVISNDPARLRPALLAGCGRGPG